MRVRFVLGLSLILSASLASIAYADMKGAEPPASMSVHSSGRYLLDGSGKPFFWLGDTAWLISQMADRKDVELFLATRARQGFTVIQMAVVMAEARVAGGVKVPNRYGDSAFVDGDPARPDVTPGNSPDNAAEYDYWDHVDFIVDTARKHGLILAAVPLFVSYGGDGYAHLTSKNAAAYGTFVGERYKGKNLIWVLGGDHMPKTDEHKAVWNTMAKAITVAAAGKEDYGATVMTYHISGGHSPVEYWAKAPWLDLWMYQTWDRHTEIPTVVKGLYGVSPPKPVVLAEAAYEDGPQYPTGPVNALMVRKQAYWSYFSGGSHTYGNTNVWNFGTYKTEATEPWKTALNGPGAKTLSVLKKFFTGLSWWEFEPAQRAFLRKGEIGTENPMHRALLAKGCTGLVVYFSGLDRLTLDLKLLAPGAPRKGKWIDPRNGNTRPTEKISDGTEQTFTTPKGWEDALLIIDAGLPFPSKAGMVRASVQSVVE